MQSNNFIIENYLLTHWKVTVFSKSDGRVEIPQNIIKQVGWKDQKYIHVGFIPGKLYLSKTDAFEFGINYLGEIKVSDRRVRIRSNFLRRCNFIHKPLNLVIADDYIILTLDNRNADSVGEIRDLIDGFSEIQKKKFINIIMQDFKVKPLSPELILLDEKKPLTFRQLGLPFRFSGFWSDRRNEIVLYNGKNRIPFTSVLYIIPGIEKMSNNQYKIGYLLLDSFTYSELVALINLGHVKTDRDIIFCTGVDYYKICNNPPNDIDRSIINKTKGMFDDKEGFLNKCFNTTNDDIELKFAGEITKQKLIGSHVESL
jgi:hypothetical protein